MRSLRGESGNFELGTIIARGRSGPVHRATTEDGRATVVKFFDTPADAEAEAQTLGSVDHPSVVRLIEQGVDEHGRCWLATPAIDGRTLAAVIEQEAPLSLDRVRALIDRLAEPVDALHRSGIVHGDLSPDNIIIGAADEVTILDLGAAHSINSDGLEGPRTSLRSTHTIDVRVTPRYASPEVVGGSLPVPASDCYAVGLLAYELVTGAFPFPEVAMPIAMLGHHASTAPLPAADHQPGLPPGVDRALLDVLAKDPDARPSTVAAFAAALRRDDDSAHWSEKLARTPWSGRRKLPRPAAAASLAGLGVAGLGVAGLGVAALIWPADPPPWEAGRAASLICNTLTEPGFESGTRPDDFYRADPTNTVVVTPNAGVGATTALRIGGNGRFGLFGEIVPVQPGTEYTFSVWVRHPSRPDTAAIYIDWLADDYSQLTQRRNEVQPGEVIGSAEGTFVTVTSVAPEEGAFAVPTVFKDGSPGALLIDEAVFGEASSCSELAG